MAWHFLNHIRINGTVRASRLKLIGCPIPFYFRLRRLVVAASIGLLAIGPAPLHAQGNEPGEIERTIPTQQQPETQVAPTVATPSPAVPAGSAVTGRFTLGAVQIEGATAFSQAELSPAFEPYLATEVDEASLNRIAAAITARYRKAGYLLSYAIVPAQDVRAGMVRIVVVEGKVDAIRIEGAGENRPDIEAIAAPLLRDAPLRERTLERVIGLVRDIPGLAVSDVRLTRSNVDPRRHSIRIVVVDNRTKALAHSDNRGADEDARMRFYTSASLSSLAVTGDELRVGLFAMPGRHFRYLFGQVAASVPIGHDGLRFSAAGSAGDQDRRGGLDARSTNLLAQLSYPLLRSRALTIVSKLVVNDWRSIGEDDGVRNRRDRLRVVRAGLDFSSETRSRLRGELIVSRGLGFDGMTRVGDPLASRPDASGRFTNVSFIAQAARPLSERLTAQAIVAGQYSDRPLLSVEEFALGGNRLGRAFDFNAITGDHGIGAGLELAYRLGDMKRGSRNVQLFGYADGGAAFQARSPSAVRDSRSLMSVGLGTRFTVAGIAFSAEAGAPVISGGAGKSVRAFVSAFKTF